MYIIADISPNILESSLEQIKDDRFVHIDIVFPVFSQGLEQLDEAGVDETELAQAGDDVL